MKPKKEETPKVQETYTTQVRLSEELSEKLKAYSDSVGASINSTICIALSDWLKSRSC